MGLFSKNFLWGSASSAHQVEGGAVNDWSGWEKANAKRLAREAEKKYGHLPSWEQIKDQATNPNNYISGHACEHYRMFREDFDSAQALGHTAHRFSLEWSRIEPVEGRFDETEIAHYREVIKALRARGIEPFVTLWHWTLPVWLAEKDGILNRQFSEYFERYTTKVAKEFGVEICFWITINEPEIYALNSHYRGIWPSQKTGFINFFRATHALNRAHRNAYRVIKKINPNAKIGASLNTSYFESAGGRISNCMKWAVDWLWNMRFLRNIHNELDFVGINYYFHNRIKGFWFNQNENKKISDMGWEIYPEGLYHVLLDLKRFQLPVYITENGVADMNDVFRADFIRDHISEINRAIAEGVDVRGYFYWSLLDNFEWDKGFWPRFGLIEVDYETQKRKIRPSAFEYKKIIEESAIKP
ncbi:MAG: glycoside hydrolase family 1 protein [Patescibacteria group bacterium]